MNPKSHTLFHFTKSPDVLKKIIKDGFWPRYCLEDVGWLGYKEFDFIAYPMVCFCDIPLSRVEEHVNFYGEFGIGLTKEWAMSNKLTPILYVAPNNHIPKTFRDLVDHTFNMEGDAKVEAKRTVRYLLAHSKPIDGNMIVNGGFFPKEFHQESEWRYVPKSDAIEDYLKRNEYEDEENLEIQNSVTKLHCSITFTPKDIRYIFVKSDTDIPDIINFIQTELDHFPGADLKLLMSRVTSLESIKRDI